MIPLSFQIVLQSKIRLLYILKSFFDVSINIELMEKILLCLSSVLALNWVSKKNWYVFNMKQEFLLFSKSNHTLDKNKSTILLEIQL